MKTTSFYPVIMTEQVARTADFYRTLFRFEATFETDWYVSLRLVKEDQSQLELAILKSGHPTVPEAYRHSVKGLILNFEVEDVDAEYERLIVGKKLPLRLELCDEAFGQRHFITNDPNGVLIDIIKIIPPSSEYSDQYK
ncbi:VOC family protein [Cytobacillus firmus]|uniref:VOC family protein n=1 Tax=Cytobacillus firmus TaxID=1399 RepID=UPI0018CDC077|nr:VOC family protein [Cytobacillus firmus]MBG9587523.1 glyoxalase [Cytobacillus firmus]